MGSPLSLFLTRSDSPVSALSSTLRSLLCITTPSAGSRSPSNRRTHTHRTTQLMYHRSPNTAQQGVMSPPWHAFILRLRELICMRRERVRAANGRGSVFTGSLLVIKQAFSITSGELARCLIIIACESCLSQWHTVEK